MAVLDGLTLGIIIIGNEIMRPQKKASPLTFLEHLRELRRRVVRIVIALLLGSIIAFLFHKEILQFLMLPAQEFIGSPAGKPIFTDPTEFLGIAVKVSLVGGLVLAIPVILYELVMFVSPGLTKIERRYLIALCPAGIVAFVAGGAFGYLVLFPPSFRFLLTFGEDVATAMIRVGPLINLEVRLLVWMGVVFELPLVIFFLTKIRVVTPRMLAHYRRYALVLAFVLGALITPTMDPINQTLVAAPIILLYEVGIWLSKLAYRGQRDADYPVTRSP